MVADRSRERASGTKKKIRTQNVIHRCVTHSHLSENMTTLAMGPMGRVDTYLHGEIMTTLAMGHMAPLIN